MISNDGSCVRALSQQIIRGLQQCVAKGSLPRQLKIFCFLIGLRNLGVTGWKFDHEKRRLASAIKVQTFTDFLTSLCTCISVAQSTALLEPVEASKRVALKEQLVEIETMRIRCLSAELCRIKLDGIVYVYFVLVLLKTRKVAEFLKHFELLTEHRISLADEEPYLHMFVSSLSLIPEAKWRSTGIFELLFSRYSLVSPLSHVRIHGIRLAAWIAPCLARDQLAVLVDKLQPRADEDELALAYDDFVARVGSDFFEKLPESRTSEDNSALLNQWRKLTGLLNECE